MVSIVPAHENGAFGNGRQPGRSDGQPASDRRRLSDTEKTLPAATGGGVTVRLSDAARPPVSGAESVRGASGSEKAHEPLPGFTADLDRKTGGLASAAEALEESREALAAALASGDSGKVAAAALKLADANAEVKEETAGFPYRASRVVEEAAVVYEPESGRYLASTRRVALSIERDPGEASVDLRDLEFGRKGVSVIHKEPAVPIGESLPAPQIRAGTGDE